MGFDSSADLWKHISASPLSFYVKLKKRICQELKLELMNLAGYDEFASSIVDATSGGKEDLVKHSVACRSMGD
jgi:hypothetical protein